ncbi:hypothetical protein BH10BAC2_BH10BAC2_35760 [soil metagenome]
MIRITISIALVCILASCGKDLTSVKPVQGRIITDSLMIYQSSNLAGNRGIFSKSFTTGDSILLVANATAPYVASQRMVYIKAGKTIGYAKLNGVSRFLIDFNAPTDPCLSIDARLIGVIEKTADQYQLIVLDTLGNNTILYQSVTELKQPEFSADGKLIFLSQKTGEGNFTILSINVASGNPLQVIVPLAGADYTNATAIDERLYFLQTRVINGKFSTEVCSVALSGADFKMQTDYTLSWVKEGFKIDHLRKVDNSTLIFTSERDSNNKEIYVAKPENFLNIRRISFTASDESYPNLVPDFVKDF